VTPEVPAAQVEDKVMELEAQIAPE